MFRVSKNKTRSLHLTACISTIQLVQGDATYLMVTDDNKIQDYGINAVCTHLGCVVPWSLEENKFICHCHGSQYDATGKVGILRTPLPPLLY